MYLDHLDVALRRYAAISSPSPGGNLEGQAGRLLDWLTRDVSVVAAELLNRPEFFRLATWAVTQLGAGSRSPHRQLVEAVDAALIAYAASLARVPVRQATAGLGFVQWVATRPWKDLVSDRDYFGPSDELNLVTMPGSAAAHPRAQLADFLPFLHEALRLPDDHVVGMMFRRIEHWVRELRSFRRGCEQAGLKVSKHCPAVQAAATRLQESAEALRVAVTHAPDARIRTACVIVAQAYAVFAAAPNLRPRSLDGTPPPADFRFWLERGEVAVADRVAAALVDVNAMYNLRPSVEQQIADAIDSCRLVLVAGVGRREAYWDGELQKVNWHKNPALWETLWQLAEKAAAGKGVDREDFGQSVSPRAIICRIDRLKDALPAALIPLIESAGRSTYRLVLTDKEIRLFFVSSEDSILAEGSESPSNLLEGSVEQQRELKSIMQAAR